MYTYSQILDKIKNFKILSGLVDYCNACGYPCNNDYDPAGYQQDENNILGVLDTCEGLVKEVFKTLPFYEDYLRLRWNLRIALYEKNLFEGTSPDDTFTYPADEIDNVYNDANAFMLKDALNAASPTLRDEFNDEIPKVLTKTPISGSPNIRESILEFYNSNFQLITTTINDTLVQDLLRKSYTRFVHLFIPGKRRLDLKEEQGIISAPVEYDNYLRFDFDNWDYKMMILDGRYDYDKLVQNVSAGYTRFIVFECFYATALLDNNGEGIYYRLDSATQDYLVKVIREFFPEVRQWTIFEEITDIPLTEIDGEKYILLNVDSINDKYGALSDKLCVAIYGIPKAGIDPGDRFKEPILRFVLKDV